MGTARTTLCWLGLLVLGAVVVDAANGDVYATALFIKQVKVVECYGRENLILAHQGDNTNASQATFTNLSVDVAVRRNCHLEVTVNQASTGTGSTLIADSPLLAHIVPKTESFAASKQYTNASQGIAHANNCNFAGNANKHDHASYDTREESGKTTWADGSSKGICSYIYNNTTGALAVTGSTANNPFGSNGDHVFRLSVDLNEIGITLSDTYSAATAQFVLVIGTTASTGSDVGGSGATHAARHIAHKNNNQAFTAAALAAGDMSLITIMKMKPTAGNPNNLQTAWELTTISAVTNKDQGWDFINADMSPRPAGAVGGWAAGPSTTGGSWKAIKLGIMTDNTKGAGLKAGVAATKGNNASNNTKLYVYAGTSLAKTSTIHAVTQIDIGAIHNDAEGIYTNIFMPTALAGSNNAKIAVCGWPLWACHATNPAELATFVSNAGDGTAANEQIVTSANGMDRILHIQKGASAQDLYLRYDTSKIVADTKIFIARENQIYGDASNYASVTKANIPSRSGTTVATEANAYQNGNENDPYYAYHVAKAVLNTKDASDISPQPDLEPACKSASIGAAPTGYIKFSCTFNSTFAADNNKQLKNYEANTPLVWNIWAMKTGTNSYYKQKVYILEYPTAALDTDKIMGVESGTSNLNLAAAARGTGEANSAGTTHKIRYADAPPSATRTGDAMVVESGNLARVAFISAHKTTDGTTLMSVEAANWDTGKKGDIAMLAAPKPDAWRGCTVGGLFGTYSLLRSVDPLQSTGKQDSAGSGACQGFANVGTVGTSSCSGSLTFDAPSNRLAIADYKYVVGAMQTGGYPKLNAPTLPIIAAKTNATCLAADIVSVKIAATDPGANSGNNDDPVNLTISGNIAWTSAALRLSVKKGAAASPNLKVSCKDNADGELYFYLHKCPLDDTNANGTTQVACTTANGPANILGTYNSTHAQGNLHSDCAKTNITNHNFDNCIRRYGAGTYGLYIASLGRQTPVYLKTITLNSADATATSVTAIVQKLPDVKFPAYNYTQSKLAFDAASAKASSTTQSVSVGGTADSTKATITVAADIAANNNRYVLQNSYDITFGGVTFEISQLQPNHPYYAAGHSLQKQGGDYIHSSGVLAHDSRSTVIPSGAAGNKDVVNQSLADSWWFYSAGVKVTPWILKVDSGRYVKQTATLTLAGLPDNATAAPANMIGQFTGPAGDTDLGTSSVVIAYKDSTAKTALVCPYPAKKLPYFFVGGPHTLMLNDGAACHYTLPNKDNTSTNMSAVNIDYPGLYDLYAKPRDGDSTNNAAGDFGLKPTKQTGTAILIKWDEDTDATNLTQLASHKCRVAGASTYLDVGTVDFTSPTTKRSLSANALLKSFQMPVAGDGTGSRRNWGLSGTYQEVEIEFENLDYVKDNVYYYWYKKTATDDADTKCHCGVGYCSSRELISTKSMMGHEEFYGQADKCSAKNVKQKFKFVMPGEYFLCRTTLGDKRGKMLHSGSSTKTYVKFNLACPSGKILTDATGVSSCTVDGKTPAAGGGVSPGSALTTSTVFAVVIALIALIL